MTLREQIEICKTTGNAFEKEIETEYLGHDDITYKARAILEITPTGEWQISVYDYYDTEKEEWIDTQERNEWKEEVINVEFFSDTEEKTIITRDHCFENRLNRIEKTTNGYRLSHEKSHSFAFVKKTNTLDRAFEQEDWVYFKGAESDFFGGGGIDYEKEIPFAIKDWNISEFSDATEQDIIDHVSHCIDYQDMTFEEALESANQAMSRNHEEEEEPCYKCGSYCGGSCGI